MSETLRMLGVIDANMHREFESDGSFKSATFELSDGTYKVDNTFVVHKMNNAGDMQKLPVHFCKGGIYPEVYISGMPIKLYALTMLATDKIAFEKYQSGLEINHCVISKMQPKLLNIGCDNAYYKGVVIDTAPLKKLSADPNYLEFCTRSENVKHGKFVKEFSLYDTYVSAHDIDELRKQLIPYDSCIEEVKDDWIESNKLKVEEFYRNKGVEQRILF
jgi:hypothetical protein|uniref:Uncharacterized protein n=1 Tax=Siphoviridae sp. ctoSr5 TaxID=2826460 RepID=A0A8S5MVY9_9CAUD|nr:MAG TPA: hypothetical protein [Siphoviridae sp. ctoSr5]